MKKSRSQSMLLRIGPAAGLVLSALISLILVLPGFAAEAETLSETMRESITEIPDQENSEEGITVNTYAMEEGVISVVLPTLGENSPFDFHIDPQGLLHMIKNTPDNIVEEGAHLLFHNETREGYAYSRISDFLTVSNQSLVPVRITVQASMDNLGEITLSEDKEFTDNEECAIYLALIDNEGNEIPITKTGEAIFTIELDRAPVEAFAYVRNEENGEYLPGYLLEGGEEFFDSYSFGLTGETNVKAKWGVITSRPKVQITWTVEPVRDKEDVLEETENLTEKEALTENASEEQEETLTEEVSEQKEETDTEKVPEEPSESNEREAAESPEEMSQSTEEDSIEPSEDTTRETTEDKVETTEHETESEPENGEENNG